MSRKVPKLLLRMMTRIPWAYPISKIKIDKIMDAGYKDIPCRLHGGVRASMGTFAPRKDLVS